MFPRRRVLLEQVLKEVPEIHVWATQRRLDGVLEMFRRI